jgi:hypothetical protein
MFSFLKPLTLYLGEERERERERGRGERERRREEFY